MQEKLRLLHQFLSEVMLSKDEDALTQLAENYRQALRAESEDDIVYQLWNDARVIGREIIFLKRCGVDAERDRLLASMTPKEKTELAEVEGIIGGNCFDYHFQPIVNAADGSIYSYEALMRPQSAMGLTPFHILKYAEIVDRLNDIERATFLNVLHRIDDDKASFHGKRVFINSIPKTKLNMTDFREVGALLVKHADTAVVEMTEQAEPDEEELNALKERYLNMGVPIAIDDYGTGYSNVKNLLRYMPQYVKIDRSLLSEIQDNPKKRHFVREIIEFCHENNIMALAEGVETSAELRAVILLGADLIQGFYTARPHAEIVESIPYEIRREILHYRQERQDGKDQQVYTAETTERILLERLVKDDYQCILIGKNCTEAGEITVVGAPTLHTDIHIALAKDFKGKIILENVHLANIKNRPCIDIGEGCDVTLVLCGENQLKAGGIRVPEGAGLTFEGEGHLEISLNAPEYFGIGNDLKSRHGALIFNQSGTIAVKTDGMVGICIGAGHGGDITIMQGRYMLEMNGDTGVGIGAMDADSKLELRTCEFHAKISKARGVAIGSLNGNADIQITRSSANLYLGGTDSAAIGTLHGSRADVSIQEAITTVNLHGIRSTCVGALHADTAFTINDAAFRVKAGGAQALPFGGFGGDTKISFKYADATIEMDTDFDVQAYISAAQTLVSGGRIQFTNHGTDIMWD